MANKKRNLIVITRPQPDADDYAQELKTHGFDVLIEPMLEIVATDFQKPDLLNYDGLLITSAQAVRNYVLGGGDVASEILVYCVGKYSAGASFEAGFSHVVSVDGTGQDLARYVLGLPNVQGKRFLHIRGEDIAYPIAKTIGYGGVNADDIIVYRAKAVQDFSTSFVSAIKDDEIAAVLFFSKRTADNFLDLIKRNGLSEKLSAIKSLSISARVLECVRVHNWMKAYVSNSPDRSGVLRILQKLDLGKAMSSKTSVIENAEDVIEAFGGIRPMAKKMDVAVTTVQGWKKRNTIPAARYDQVLKAAKEHDVDLSDLLTVANENVKVSEVETVEVKPAAIETEIIVPLREEKASKSEEDVRALKAQIADIEKHAVRKSTGVSVIVAVALIVVTVGVLGFVMWPKGDFQAQEAARLAALEEKMGAVEQDVEGVKEEQSFLGTIVPKDLDKQIADLKEKAVATKDNAVAAYEVTKEKAGEISRDVLAEDAGTYEERMEKLGGHVQEISEMPAVAGMLSKVEAWQDDLAGQEQIQQSMDALNLALGSAGGSVDGAGQSITQILENARQESTALGTTFEGVPQEDLKAAALLLGMTQMRSSLNRDNDAFNSDLDVLRKLVGDGNPELNAALDRLAPHAQSGVLTPSGLSNEFRTFAGDALVASLSGEDVSVQERASARMHELFSVEQDGELVTGTETQATLARTQHLLNDGDLEGAIGSAQSLDGAAAQAMAPWLDKANATLMAQKVKTLLTNGIDATAKGGSITADGGVLGPFLPSGSRYIEDESSGMNVYVPAGGVHQ